MDGTFGLLYKICIMFHNSAHKKGFSKSCNLFPVWCNKNVGNCVELWSQQTPNQMKMYTRPLLFLITLFLFISCSSGRYVSSEPRRVEMIRPRQPSSLHVWIDGDWIWQKDTRTYRNSYGRWELPNRNRNYIPGYWENRKKGKRWMPGRWNN